MGSDGLLTNHNFPEYAPRIYSSPLGLALPLVFRSAKEGRNGVFENAKGSSRVPELPRS